MITQHYVNGLGSGLLTEQTGTAVTSYSYDLSGNLASINAAGLLTTYSWNTDNRLTQVANPDGSGENLTYGSDGLRRSKTVTPAVGSPITTHFVYGGRNLHQERNASGLVLVQNTWGPDNWNMGTGPAWSAGDISDTMLLQRKALT